MLVQFPPWFIAGGESFDHLLEIRERLPDHLIAIEFRSPSWFDGRHGYATVKFERANQMGNVVVNEPSDLLGSIPTVWAATNPKRAIFRLHGRNRDTWNKPGLTAASERFNYECTDQELPIGGGSEPEDSRPESSRYPLRGANIKTRASVFGRRSCGHSL